MDFTVEMTLRLFLASLLGGMIGLERELHGRPAGFRTHLLVSLGSCLFVVSSICFYRFYANTSGVGPLGVDPGRVAAQVVPGIGFLGAGAIIREGTSVRGLTTAACLWVAASVGVGCGIGIFGISFIVTLIALLSLLLLKRLEKSLRRETYAILRVVCEDLPGQMPRIEAEIFGCDTEILDAGVMRDNVARELALDYVVRFSHRSHNNNLIDSVAALEGVRRVSMTKTPLRPSALPVDLE